MIRALLTKISESNSIFFLSWFPKQSRHNHARWRWWKKKKKTTLWYPFHFHIRPTISMLCVSYMDSFFYFIIFIDNLIVIAKQQQQQHDRRRGKNDILLPIPNQYPIQIFSKWHEGYGCVYSNSSRKKNYRVRENSK